MDLAYTRGINPNLARKTLVGLIHDLAQIYAGKKSLAELDLERDAVQVLYIIKSLEDLGNYVESSMVTRRLREIIETNIRDGEMRRAYLEAINYYLQTQPDIPRSKEFLETLLERERELEQRLIDTKLPRVEIDRVKNFIESSCSQQLNRSSQI